MSESTPSTPMRKPVRMCVRCHHITETPVVVAQVHQDSGPGWNVYACPDCAPRFPPVPDALELIRDGRRRRGNGAE